MSILNFDIFDVFDFFNKKIIYIITFVLIIFLLIFFVYNNSSKNLVCIEDKCFEVEIADTFEKRKKWLMFVENLEVNKWMLFVYQNPWIYKFWMKNTMINLDILRINENKEIIYISKNTPICEVDKCPNYWPKLKSKYVLEINAGLSDLYWIKKWDLVEFDLFVN